jgi:type I restriction enzyme, S subunit
MAAAEWEIVALAELATLDIERVPVQPDDEYRPAGVMIAGQGLFWRETIRGRETNYPALHRLKTGQLVMRKLTAWEGPITTVPPEFEGGYVSSEFPTFTLDSTRLLPAYMRLVCQRPTFHAEMRLRSTGTAERRNRLKPADLLSIAIELPAIDEQERIVALIAAVDDAIAATQSERQANVTLRRALLAHVLTELEDRAEETERLGDIAEVTSGIAWAKGDERDAGSGVPALRVANVQLDGIELGELRYVDPTTAGAANKLLNKDGVILVRTNTPERVGNAQVVPDDAIGMTYSSFLIQVTAKSSDHARLIARFLQTPEMQERMTDRARGRGTSASLTNIPVTWLRTLDVPIPAERDLDGLLHPLDRLEDLAATVREEQARLRELRAALLDSLLSGHRRVRADELTPR